MSWGPVDGETGNPWFIGEDGAIEEGNVDGIVHVKIIIIIIDGGILSKEFVVDVVADPNEFFAAVGAGQDDDCNSDDVFGGNQSGVRGVPVEYEFIDPRRDGPHEDFHEDLIM